MKRETLIRLCVVIGILALAGSASVASSVEDQVKKLAERYNQIEGQLNRYATR
jgi:hypothetical protein